MRRTRHKWADRLLPADDNLEDAAPKDKLVGSILSWVATVMQIFLFLPWYFTPIKSKAYVAAWKSHYYIPHLMLLAVFAPGSPLVIGVVWYIGIFTGWRGVMAFVYSMTAVIDGLAGTDYLRQTKIAKQEQQIEAARQQIDPSDVPDDKFLIPDSGMQRFDADEPVAWLDKSESVIAFGKTQRGKSSNIKTLAAQLDYSTDTAVVAHGSRDDYTRFFADQLGLDVETLNIKNGSARWNLFKEVPPNTPEWERELIFEDIARVLIPKSDEENPHFPDSARLILDALMQIIYDSDAPEYADPDHSDLYSIVFDFDRDRSKHDSKAEEIKSVLQDKGHHAAADKIRPGQKGDAWGTVTRQLRRNLKGDFRKTGSFSFREYFENPRGRVVSVESAEDLKAGKEMYSAMLDRANKQAMGDDSGTTTYFVYDEITKIGAISNLTDLATRGLKQGSRMIVGVQTLPQLVEIYGEQGAETVVDNMGQVLAFQSTSDTAEYIQRRLGDVTEVTESVSRGTKGSLSRTQSEVRRSPVEESTIAGLDPGESIVIGPGSEWWHVHWQHPDQAIPRMARERGSVSTAQSAPARSSSTAD
jgi:hypothetical protein